MKISIDWINDFVDLKDIDAKELAQKFTLSCAEVEDVLESNAFLKKIVVAQIKAIKKHPKADTLNLVTFGYGEGKEKEVVCGAQNVREGMKIPYAPLGTKLPSGLVLEAKKIRDILSEGMLCSEEELGLKESSDGLFELDKNAHLGQTMEDYLKISSDVILDVDNKSLTNRPDLWGHLGIAREFAAIFKRNFKKSFNQEWETSLKAKCTDEKSPIEILVEGENACLIYSGLSIDNVTIQESPKWMQERLVAVGLRPINNIVDISNYVMLEIGTPMHIFDREQIVGDKIIIRNANTGEKLITLDEQTRELLHSDTVICDSKGPLVLAGIMGGVSSGVSEKTSKIFLEVANWKAHEVRKTSTRLGLRTDSSLRFEKSLDSLQTHIAMLRALELVLLLCPQARVVGKITSVGPHIDYVSCRKIQTSSKRISSILGKEISSEEIENILARLGFKVVKQELEMIIEVPSYRATKDISVEADIVEEIGRIIGYDNITPVSPLEKIAPVKLTEKQKLHRQIRDFLVLRSGACEIMTYPMVGKDLLDKAGFNSLETLQIYNPISKEHDRMRNSLLPSILNAVYENQKYYREFRLFELARSYLVDKSDFSKERSILAVAFYSKDNSVFLNLLDSVDMLLGHTNLNGDFIDKNPKFLNPLFPKDYQGLHPHEYQDIRIMGKISGAVFSIHPLLLGKYKLRGNLSVALIDLTEHEDKQLKNKVKYSPISKFNPVEFDCTVVAPKNIYVANILKTLKNMKKVEVLDYKVVDIFSLDADRSAVTIRTLFHDNEKGLTPETIKSLEDEVVFVLKSAGFDLKS